MVHALGLLQLLVFDKLRTFVCLIQLNFAKYERSGQFSYKMIPAGKVQVPGFSNNDQYLEVVAKGPKGLGITTSPDRLSLIVSEWLDT